MKQSRLMSWIETVAGTAIGFAIALATQLVVFPLFGFSPPLSHNLAITTIFTAVSLARGFALRRLFEALHIRTPLSPALLAIAAERRRQIEVEGFTAEHDDTLPAGALSLAGSCYALMPSNRANHRYDDGSKVDFGTTANWPWSLDWWKPTDDRRDLTKACALVLADLERLYRNRGRRAA